MTYIQIRDSYVKNKSYTWLLLPTLYYYYITLCLGFSLINFCQTRKSTIVVIGFNWDKMTWHVVTYVRIESEWVTRKWSTDCTLTRIVYKTYEKNSRLPGIWFKLTNFLSLPLTVSYRISRGPDPSIPFDSRYFGKVKST